MAGTGPGHVGRAVSPVTRAPWIVITGLDGSGKTGLAQELARTRDGFFFRLPYHDFVLSALPRSGYGAPFGDVHTRSEKSKE
jgi:predicted ATPase